MNYINFFYVFLICFISVSCVNENLENEKDEFYLSSENSLSKNSDFYQVLSYQIGNLKTIRKVNSFSLLEGLLIEEISEKEYLNLKQSNPRFYLKDTLNMFKVDNSIMIGNTKLKDKVYKNGSFESYLFLGYFPILDQYLVKGTYLDSLDFKLIDKKTGQIKQSLISYPIISKNGNFIATCRTNSSENITYFEIFNYTNEFYQNAFKAEFTHWKVVDFEEFAFWGSDGSLYMKVSFSNKKMKNKFVKITLN